MSILGKIANFFIGGAADTVVDTASGVADIVERFNPGPGGDGKRTDCRD